MSKLEFLSEELGALKEQGLFNVIRTIDGPQGAWFVVDGRKVLNLCSNNYLGFADHPRLKEAAKKAIDEYGVGPGAVRSIAGTQTIHLELERKLADFKHAPACIVLQAGFSANTAVIPAITGRGDVIFSDELNHASIIDGCRLSRADVVRYQHNDVDDLRNKIIEHKDSARRMLIVTDGVFSMDGDIAPLPEIVEIADEFGAIVMVDDAHGEGVLGDSGRGIVNHFRLEGRVDIEVGTLSKAFGVMGGFVTGPEVLIDYLRQRARPFLFSSGLTPADTAAAIAAVDMLLESDEPVKTLWDNAAYFQKGLKEAGFDTGGTQTPITPVMLGEAKLASEFSKKLFEKGIFAQSISYPTVPRGKARIRCMVSAAHSKQDLDFALEKFVETAKELGVLS
ncbi:MAG: glycine C-acetyltransferase [Bacillota bacterium]|jgi:glycine C-acetyltransferase|nr:glycine C-acetyltransferase [Bacillota bacterium]HOP70961.1 glycine C-acetyltransferase [Bacillota bacterium]HPT35693.1 glycine C-acetyltransferase [Bacillota bacterium]HPZ85086.1 glycine C-acetyltransferase [Bacillota bacterium]HQD85744.1 glycine C-acetyltransferase [Bacillota bacterium]